MYFIKNISFLKTSGQMVNIAVFSVFLNTFQDGSKICSDFPCFKNPIHSAYLFSKSCFWKEIWPPVVDLIN